jgi:hypothetical protein
MLLGGVGDAESEIESLIVKEEFEFKGVDKELLSEALARGLELITEPIGVVGALFSGIETAGLIGITITDGTLPTGETFPGEIEGISFSCAPS